ncbi:MAG: hypothetical protein FWD74_11890, partial [Actinomycetia bacterium]|nr:hypothetical protein [Actinomycetes bacterium]
GIDLVTDFAVESVDNTAKQLVSYDERRVDFDLLVTIPLNLGADYIARSGMGDDLNLVPCDQHTMAALDYPDTWVLGDAGTLATSKAGSVAHFSIDVFMENFMAAWRGEEPEGKFDGHANCFVETGHGKGMLLDFNYKTQPLTGVFPFPGVGPMKLLKESRINHLGKLGFYWVYWHLLLPGRRIPIPADMKMSGKIVPSESADSAAAPSAAAPAAIVAPKEPAAAESAPAAPARKKPATPKPAAKAASSEVLDQPIIPTF